MTSNAPIKAQRVHDEPTRREALSVMRAIYRDEKGWVTDDERLIARADIAAAGVSWFVVKVGDRPVGVLRVLYELPLEEYRAYGLRMVREGIDVEAFLRHNRIAEIGRFAVLPAYRGRIFVVAALMKAAVQDTVERGFTHYITDVFEGERHSPYEFHTRVMGFQVVATHDTGELNCPNRRLTMLLDLREGYQRLKRKNGWIFRFLTRDWPREVHDRLAAATTGTTGR